jgi:3-deoxy-manno-octulosonate cytidylyltransferase (CMP-KDO synthetase)
MNRCCVIIPCRYGSTRFNGKPLSLLNKKPLMFYPYSAAKKANKISEVYIATDDERVSDVCKKYNMNYIMTGNKHYCGTDRVAEAYKKISKKFDIVINVQGDEPFITSSIIDSFAKFMIKNKKYSAANGVSIINNVDDILNAGVVKAVINKNKKIIYFSRNAIPYPHHKTNKSNYFRQLGLYGFRPDGLKIFIRNKPHVIERKESVEMLRLIENNVDIHAFVTKINGPAVDTEGDLEVANRIMSAK